MIRSTVCIAAFLVARIGGCSAPEPRTAVTPAETGPEVRHESPYDSAPAALAAPGEGAQALDGEGAPPGDPAVAGPTGDGAIPAEGPWQAAPAPLGFPGGMGAEALLDLPPGGDPAGEGVIVTPEPATLVLAGAGLVLGALWRRRRRRSARSGRP